MLIGDHKLLLAWNRRQGCPVHLRYPDEVPVLQVVKHRIDCSRIRGLEFADHRPVRLVAHPAGHASLPRQRHTSPPEPDALHPPEKPNPLPHCHYDIICEDRAQRHALAS